MAVSPEMRKALEAYEAASKREVALASDVDAAHDKWTRTKNPADAPTTELHTRWREAREQRDAAWAEVRSVQDRELGT